MVVGLDIDDTITLHTGFFSWLTRSLLASGHEVIIITTRLDPRRTRDDLVAWGIEYSELVTMTAEAIEAHGLDGWKGAVCARRGVEILFEDELDVLAHLSRGVIGFRGSASHAGRS